MADDSEPAVVVGCFIDEPPPGSIDSTCDACGEPIILGPESQRVLRDRAGTLKACISCILEVMPVNEELGYKAQVRRAKDFRT